MHCRRSRTTTTQAGNEPSSGEKHACEPGESHKCQNGYVRWVLGHEKFSFDPEDKDSGGPDKSRSKGGGDEVCWEWETLVIGNKWKMESG